MKHRGPTALVTGANRGIGLEVCRQLGHLGQRIVVASRSTSAGEEAVEQLRQEKLDALTVTMDVSCQGSIQKAASQLLREDIHIDVLINNAGVYPSGELLTVGTESMRHAFNVHLYGPLWTCQIFVPAMQARGYGRVVNVSSSLGAFAEGIPGSAPYGISKAALNALTVKLASDLRGNVKINAACPGWVRTDLGGPDAPISPHQAATGIVWLATLPKDGPNGGFFRNHTRIDW